MRRATPALRRYDRCIMRNEDDISCLSRELNLTDVPQDWGIINADAARVNDFIWHGLNKPLSIAQAYVMGELVMASVNEAMSESKFDDGTQKAFHLFLQSNLVGLQHHISYWSKLENDEYPLASYLRNGAASY